jgi:hypothetical protein
MMLYWNTIDGKLTNFIPRVNGSKIMIGMAIGETHVQILIIDRESGQRSRRVYVRTLTADGGL